MNKQFHIPIPLFNPTENDKIWVMENIAPLLYPAIAIIKGAFDRVDLPQQVFDTWPQRDAVERHFNDLNLPIRRFSCFIAHRNQNPSLPHIDAFLRGVPMVARFNIPYYGLSPVQIDWWADDIAGGKIEERVFTELRHGKESLAYSFKSAIPEWNDPPLYSTVDPGSGWNRTDVAHRVQAPLCNENRIVISTETATQIPWIELVDRLSALGHC